MILFAFFSLFLIAVPQEDRVVYRYRKLKHGCKSFGDERYLTLYEVRSHVIDYRHAHAEHKEQWDKERIHCKCKYDTCKYYCDNNIHRSFLHCQILDILND